MTAVVGGNAVDRFVTETGPAGWRTARTARSFALTHEQVSAMSDKGMARKDTLAAPPQAGACLLPLPPSAPLLATPQQQWSLRRGGGPPIQAPSLPVPNSATCDQAAGVVRRRICVCILILILWQGGMRSPTGIALRRAFIMHCNAHTLAWRNAVITVQTFVLYQILQYKHLYFRKVLRYLRSKRIIARPVRPGRIIRCRYESWVEAGDVTSHHT